MKNRPLWLALLVGALAGLVFGASPARAANLSWEDPAGDANLLPLLGVPPPVGGVPSEPAYDITAVRVSNDGGNLVWELAVPGLVEGHPSPSTGYFFRMFFDYEGDRFVIGVSEDSEGQQQSRLALSTTNYGQLPPPALDCQGCEGRIDRVAKKVVYTAPLMSLDQALQSADRSPLAGQEWTGLIAASYRPLAGPNPEDALPANGLVLLTDDSYAPEDSTLRF